MSVSTQVPAVGLVVGGSTVVVVPAGAEVTGAEVTAGADVTGADVTGEAPTGAKVAGAEVPTPMNVGTGLGLMVVIIPPPQPQHISSMVNAGVSKMLLHRSGFVA